MAVRNLAGVAVVLLGLRLIGYGNFLHKVRKHTKRVELTEEEWQAHLKDTEK